MGQTTFLFRAHPDTVSAGEVDRSFHNKAILAGYRPCGRSWSYYTNSLFHLHNETFNVWTQLIGMVVLACLTIHLATTENQEEGVMAPIWIQGICSLTNHFFSAVTHWFRPKSLLVNECIYYLDYIGIAMLTLGNHILVISLSDDRRFINFLGAYAYVFPVALSCFLSLGMCYARAFIKPHKPHIVKYYNIFYNFVSLSSAIVLLVLRFYFAEVSKTTDPLEQKVFLLHQAWCSLFILCGVFYGSHVPECFFPGKFDIFGHSHMTFHMIVTSGCCIQQMAAFYDIELGYISPEMRVIMTKYGSAWTYFFIACLLNGAILAYFLRVVIQRENRSKSKKIG